MAENFYTIKTFYRTDDVNNALIKEKVGFLSLSNPIAKKGKETQYMAKEYDFNETAHPNMGSLRDIKFKLRIYKYGTQVPGIKVDGWDFPAVFNAYVLRDDYRIYSVKCEFNCADPNGRIVSVKFEVGGCSFIKALWVTLNYIIKQEPPSLIPTRFEMSKSYMENYFYSHYSF